MKNYYYNSSKLLTDCTKKYIQLLCYKSIINNCFIIVNTFKFMAIASNIIFVYYIFDFQSAIMSMKNI